MPPKQKKNNPGPTEDNKDESTLVCSLTESALAEISAMFDSKVTNMKKELTAHVEMLVAQAKLSLQDSVSGLEVSLNAKAMAFEEYKRINDDTISEMSKAMEKMTTDIEQLRGQKKEMSISIGNAERNAKDALIWANEIEQYGRRWLVRVHGVKETPKEDCRKLVLELFKDKLKVNTQEHDIEAAHRVGRVIEGKTRGIIVRFCRRDVKQTILTERRVLAKSGFSIMEDLTTTNMKLLNRLNNSEKIERAWATNGKIIGLLHNCTNKIRFYPYENIEDTIAKFHNS